MPRARIALTKGLAVAGAMALGALAATTLVADAAPAQDPAVQAQIQQAMTNLQNQLRTELSLMQTKITNLENELQNLRMERDLGRVGSSGTNIPTPVDPIPGAQTFGRIQSLAVESQRIVARSGSGAVQAQLGTTADGPGMVIYDSGGRISLVLVATPSGGEIRVADAEGNLQTVWPAQ